MSKEVSMFSELEVQSEISQLLDELYGNLERAFPGGVGGRDLPAFFRSILEERKRERRQKSISRYEL